MNTYEIKGDFFMKATNDTEFQEIISNLISNETVQNMKNFIMLCSKVESWRRMMKKRPDMPL